MRSGRTCKCGQHIAFFQKRNDSPVRVAPREGAHSAHPWDAPRQAFAWRESAGMYASCGHFASHAIEQGASTEAARGVDPSQSARCATAIGPSRTLTAVSCSAMSIAMRRRLRRPDGLHGRRTARRRRPTGSSGGVGIEPANRYTGQTGGWRTNLAITSRVSPRAAR